MQIVEGAGEFVPDPRPAAFEQIRELPVPAITFVPQATVDDAVPGFLRGSDQTGLRDMSVSFTYTLIRNPDDRAAPENLRELDEDTQRALEMLPSLDRPAWIVEMAERARYPQLHEAVRTSWYRAEDEYSTVDAVLLHHVNHVLMNHFRAERGWAGLVGGMRPAPDVTAAAIQRDAGLVVDGDPLDGIRVNTDPHVYALGARLPSGGILTVVVPRDDLDYLKLEFQTYAIEPTPAAPQTRPAPAHPRLQPPAGIDTGAVHAMPGHPWPHDMVITVTDDPHVLVELLWIREAWQLRPSGQDLPPLLVDTPAPVSTEQRRQAPIAEWEAAWPSLWHECLLHAGTPRDPGAFDRMSSAPPGAERGSLIREIVGPSWDDVFGRDALTEEYQKWQRMLFQRRTREIPRPLDEQPERLALDALVPAWRAGLTTIIQIPCQGTFTRVIGAHALLVTAETRIVADSYRSALAAFR